MLSGLGIEEEEEEELVPFLPCVPVLDQNLYGGFELGFNVDGDWWVGNCGWLWFLDLRIRPICEYWKLIVHHLDLIRQICVWVLI